MGRCFLRGSVRGGPRLLPGRRPTPFFCRFPSPGPPGTRARIPARMKKGHDCLAARCRAAFVASFPFGSIFAGKGLRPPASQVHFLGCLRPPREGPPSPLSGFFYHMAKQLSRGEEIFSRADLIRGSWRAGKPNQGENPVGGGGNHRRPPWDLPRPGKSFLSAPGRSAAPKTDTINLTPPAFRREGGRSRADRAGGFCSRERRGYEAGDGPGTGRPGPA
jgi:hypothetical protein